jgi:hypothetical protein
LGTRDQTAGFSPFNAVLAGSYAADPSMGNLTTGINLGRNATLGPGHGFDTGSAIEQAQSTPQHIAPGDTLVINPKAGNAPGNVVYGGDPAAAKAEEQQRVSNQTDADRRAGLAESASQQLPENDRLMEIYNRLVNTPGTSDTASVIGSEGMKLLSRWTNADLTRLSPREGAILAIQQRLGAVVNAQLQSTQAGDPVRGLLNRIQPPDPARLDPEQFRAAMEQYKRVLKYQAEEGSIAYGFRTSGKTKADSDKYLADLKAHADAVFKEQQAGSGGEGGGGGGGGGQVHVYTSEAEVNADIAAGELHDGDKIRIGRGPNAITGTVGQLK